MSQSNWMSMSLTGISPGLYTSQLQMVFIVGRRLEYAMKSAMPFYI